jgi:segregation and condensation protein B
MNNETLAIQIEGLLFALGRPLSHAELAKMTDMDMQAITQALLAIHDRTEKRGVVLVDDGTMVELRAAPEAAALIEKVRTEEYSREIGKAGLEALAAILYKGPLSRSDIDFIRGVNSSQTIRTLLMRGLVRKVPNPRDERSFLYEATTELLAQLGATHSRDLPEYDEMREKLDALEESYKNEKA